MQFFGGDETVTPPYIQISGDNAFGTPYFNMADLQTGTLADYLGIPTVINGTYGKTQDAVYMPLNLLAPVSLENLAIGFSGSSSVSNFSDLHTLIAGNLYKNYFSEAAYKGADKSTDSWMSFRFSSLNFLSDLKQGNKLYIDFGFNFDPSKFGTSWGISLLSGEQVLTASVSGTCSLVSGTLYEITLSGNVTSSAEVTGILVSFAKPFIVDAPVIREVTKPNQDVYYVLTTKPSFVYPRLS